ncbi:thioesterase family protein [Rhabdothermincola salaria]|uniref:thioesterase family protein n=1 Tax=Rhabdothermincola salaria TaxID=2903142 RepID=UPI001E3CA138|nr:thioesterase family protein [Rhabdothermincola salaria]MCD9622861.1 thioesterase family protein [Rhabdothermincola salaria]
MFIPDGDDAVVATVLTQGPWDPNAQYGGTPAALLTWAVERVPTLVPMRIARLTVDMHRPVPLGRLGVGTEIVREGKRLQIVVATITADGAEVARATALRFRTGPGPDTWSDPDQAPITAPPFGAVRPQRVQFEGRNGFTGALEVREAGDRSPGTSWYRATRPVIAGEEASPTVRLAWASDFTANSANHLDLARWSAINADLTISLARAPRGEWTGVATRSWYGTDGIGLSRADLFDRDGFVGTCTAALLVDEVAAPYNDPS